MLVHLPEHRRPALALGNDIEIHRAATHFAGTCGPNIVNPDA